MIRYRVQIFFDVFVGDVLSDSQRDNYAKYKAQEIAKKIPDSWIEEVKRLPNGDELIWDGEFRKEIINE